jgi:hypothetical protein
MRNRSFTLWNIAGLALVFALSINDSDAQAKVTSALIKPDTTVTLSSSQDTLQYQFSNLRLSDERQAKSGNLAMLMSAILPGSGQIYAHRYYTLPLIWGFGYYFIRQFKDADAKYNKYRSLYSQSLVDSIKMPLQTFYQTQREDWHSFRDEMGVYLVLTYILNIIDAYVGATLYNFDVSDDLGGSTAIRFRIPIR